MRNLSHKNITLFIEAIQKFDSKIIESIELDNLYQTERLVQKRETVISIIDKQKNDLSKDDHLKLNKILESSQMVIIQKLIELKSNTKEDLDKIKVTKTKNKLYLSSENPT